MTYICCVPSDQFPSVSNNHRCTPSLNICRILESCRSIGTSCDSVTWWILVETFVGVAPIGRAELSGEISWPFLCVFASWSQHHIWAKIGEEPREYGLYTWVMTHISATFRWYVREGSMWYCWSSPVNLEKIERWALFRTLSNLLRFVNGQESHDRGQNSMRNWTWDL